MWVLDAGLASKMAAVWNYESSIAHLDSARVLTRPYRMPFILGAFWGEGPHLAPHVKPSTSLSGFPNQQEAEILVHFVAFHRLGQTALQPVLADLVG